MGPLPVTMLCTDNKSFRRLLTLAVLCFGMGEVNVAAQCPGQLRQALFKKDTKTVRARYYNAGIRAVKEIQFILSLRERAANGQVVLGSFNAKKIIHPGQEEQLEFRYRPDVALQGPMEMEIVRVLFIDGVTWNPARNQHCKMAVQETGPSDAAQ